MGQRGRSDYTGSLLPFRYLLEGRQVRDSNELVIEVDGANTDNIHQAP